MHKKSLYIAVKAFESPPIGESYKFDAMIEYVTIKELKE